MDTDFSNRIYTDVQKLFGEGELEILVRRTEFSIDQPDETRPGVRVVHTSTGIEETCEEFATQTQNFIAAAIRLRIACDEHRA